MDDVDHGASGPPRFMQMDRGKEGTGISMPSECTAVLSEAWAKLREWAVLAG